MVYNGETYYYIKNTLGDIVGIRNSSGTQVATYSYDAWGNIISKTGTMADINPFRYRGYYYDNETGFYYLQTRYYDPTICRFINADNYELLGTLSQNIGQLNLYSYCANNPIMYTDESGESITLALLGIALIGVGLTVAGVATNNSTLATVGLVITSISLMCTILPPPLTFSFGTASLSVSGAELLIAGTTAAVSVGIVLSQVPMQGTPNSFIQNGDSFGEYDDNGNLIYRTDMGHKHFIKELQEYFQPHTHKFEWRLIKGVWRFIETVLPR